MALLLLEYFILTTFIMGTFVLFYSILFTSYVGSFVLVTVVWVTVSWHWILTNVDTCNLQSGSYQSYSCSMEAKNPTVSERIIKFPSVQCDKYHYITEHLSFSEISCLICLILLKSLLFAPNTSN